MIISIRKIWLFVKHYWWIIVACLVFICSLLTGMFNKKVFLKILSDRQDQLKGEQRALDKTFEEQKEINKNYKEGLKFLAEKQGIKEKEISKENKAKLKEAAEKSKFDKVALAREIAKLYDLEYVEK